MNKNFREWYLTVNASPQEGQIEKRIKAIESYCMKIEALKVVNLVKMYYELNVVQRLKEEFVNSFIETDNSFSIKYEEEIKLLAGATLVYLSENKRGMDSIAELFSLSIHCFRVPCVTDEVYAAISSSFDNDSINIRKSSLEKGQIKELPIIDFSKNVNKNGLDSEEAIEELMSILNLTQESFEILSRRVENYEELTSIYTEDSQILWWLMSEHCNQLNLPLKSIHKTKACLILGKEVSDFITNYPGPHSISAVLNKMIERCEGKSEKNTIDKIIDRLPVDWKESFIDSIKVMDVIDLLPICSAIVRSKNTEDSSEWYLKFKKEIISRTEEPMLTQREFAWHMYIECLALKCFNDFNS